MCVAHAVNARCVWPAISLVVLASWSLMGRNRPFGGGDEGGPIEKGRSLAPEIADGMNRPLTGDAADSWRV